MTKISVLFLLVLFSVAANAQNIIEHPSFKGSTANYIKIQKIERSDTATVIDFIFHYPPGMKRIVPKETYIRDSRGGDTLYVKSAKGIEIGGEHFMPESGLMEYTLVFPAVGEGVKTIDYIEGVRKIYGIDLGSSEKFSVFPEPLLGNWLRTDGSNEWVYGFYEDLVIYDSDIWKQVFISQKDDVYEVVLQKEGKREKFIVKQQGDLLLAGTAMDNLETYSRERIEKPSYVIANDEEFRLPVFKKDTAVYCGYIKGYHPDMGKTGMIYVNNIISQERESYLIAINPDGTYTTQFLMIYPQQVFVRMLNFNDAVYCEPGKTTFQLNDYSKYYDQIGPGLLFMGHTARVNQDLMAMKGIQFSNYHEMREKILEISPKDYKAYYLDIKNKELEALNEYAQSHAVSKKALQIKKMQISFNASQNILSFNMNRETAYRRKHQIPQDQYEIPLEKAELSKDFYNFINPDELNYPLSVVAGNDYYYLINRIKFSDIINPSGSVSVNFWEVITSDLEKRGIALEASEKKLFEKIADCETDEQRSQVALEDSAVFNAISRKYKDVIREIASEIMEKKSDETFKKGLKDYFNMEAGFATDIMKAQDRFNRMQSTFKPLSEKQKEQVKIDIQDDFIVADLLEASAELEKEIAKMKESFHSKTGFVVNETPEVTEGDLFDTIMKKYEGKVVFVDFWATWCGPCRSGMKRIKPLKEELKDKDMVFVYITNPSSPKKTWETLIPDIHGEHYYLTQDEWNTIAARFKVSGIPHYVLVDKKGNVVQDKVYFASSNTELKKLFEEHLEN